MDRSINLDDTLSKYFFPTFLSYLFFSSSIIPSLSSDKLSSDSEHNIPYELIFLIFVTDNFILFFGIIAPGGA